MVEKRATWEPIRQIAAHELVLAQLRSAMEAGQFRPGDHLPTERELAEMLQVSRTVVRAAIAVLEHENRILVRRGRLGGFIVQPPTYDPAEAKAALRNHRAAAQEALDFRLVLEGSAARLAAERRRNKDLAEMRKLLKLMDAAMAASLKEQTPHNVLEFETHDAAFHLLVAEASRNQLLRDAVQSTRRKVWAPVGNIFWRLEENAHDRHADIVDAIAAKDPTRAEESMRQHIEDTRLNVESWLKR